MGIVPEGCHASGKLKRVRAEDAFTISSPECGCCQVDMLEALRHIVAQERHLLECKDNNALVSWTKKLLEHACM